MLFLHHMPIVIVARTDKFSRGMLLAQSLKYQLGMIKAARLESHCLIADELASGYGTRWGEQPRITFGHLE